MITLQVNWAPNPPVEQVTSYDVAVTRNGTPAGNVNVPTNSYSIENPVPGVWGFSVRANNVAGSSAFSAPVQGPNVPSVPTNLVVTSVIS